MLFQIPQRYRFSSKSQLQQNISDYSACCFRYHKGTDFQANHNMVIAPIFSNSLFQIPQRYRFSSKSQRDRMIAALTAGCFRYHKGTDFQANHNSAHLQGGSVMLFQIPQRYRFSSKSQQSATSNAASTVVLDTTKVQIFKQITTVSEEMEERLSLFQIPQRYRFSSKSQRTISISPLSSVVLDTTKVQIFKQITTYGSLLYRP